MTDFNPDDFLDAGIVEQRSEQVILPAHELDPRLKSNSYSSSLTLHACPRKFQLYKLQSLRRTSDSDEDKRSNVTLNYGTVVGIGIQEMLAGKTLDEAIWQMFIAWECDYLDEHTKANKSFPSAVYALMQFETSYHEHNLDDYELVYYNGKPAVELGFIVKLPDGYKYKGWVDVVLKHKVTGAVLVVELKTTGAKWVSPSSYTNSSQAVGYSVVLDAIFPKLSSYNVIYLIYSSSVQKYTVFQFVKTLYQRALWLQSLHTDTKLVELYHDDGDVAFPMYGESCYKFFKDCEYLGVCTLPTEQLTSPLTQRDLKLIAKDDARYEIVVDFYDLVDRQIEKGAEI